MPDQGSRVSRPIEEWEREIYAQGSEACRNYSSLTMRVRTLAQQALLAAAAGLGAAIIGKDEIDHFDQLMWIVGLLLAVFALSLFFVDWHYQSAFAAIRNHLTTIEARHPMEEVGGLKCHDGPWTAHLSVRTTFWDHVANYLPFLLIGEVGVIAAIHGLRGVPVWTSALKVVAATAVIAFIASCFLARRHDGEFKGQLEKTRGLVRNGTGSDRSILADGLTVGDDPDDGDGALPG